MPFSIAIISAFSANSAMVCFAGQVADLVNRAHHFTVDRIMQNFLDETAIDFEKVDREVLEVTERRQTGTEIVQRKLTTEFFERINKPVCLRVAGNRSCLRNLEADLRRIQSAHLELIDDEGQELVIPETLSGKVDGAHYQSLTLVRL